MSFTALCTPKRTTIGGSINWKEHTFLNSYLSSYNGTQHMCPSLQKQELDHLSHSGNGVYEYGDEICLKGT